MRKAIGLIAVLFPLSLCYKGVAQEAQPASEGAQSTTMREVHGKNNPAGPTMNPGSRDETGQQDLQAEMVSEEEDRQLTWSGCLRDSTGC